jgi:hypothetical protein
MRINATMDDALGDTIKRTVSPTVSGLIVPLAEAMVTFELRGPDIKLGDGPTKEIQMAQQQLLDNNKKGLDANEVQSADVKFVRLQHTMEAHLRVKIDIENSELSIVARSRVPNKFYLYQNISEENNWDTAIAFMQRSALHRLKRLTFVCWYPKPLTPKVRHIMAGLNCETSGKLSYS